MAMLDHFDSEITFAIPTNLDLQAMEFPNVTVLLSGMDDLDFNQLTHNLDYHGGSHELEYNRFMGDVWVGIVLTLMIVTSIFCMCACFLYHKFRQWKASVSHFQSAVAAMDNTESGGPDSAYDSDSLPSYTLVSGLPSYDDALECYRKAQVTGSSRPSIMKLFSFDNPLLGSQIKEAAAANASGEALQQVVVIDNKDSGLPSYQESIVNEKKRTNIKRSVHRPMLPIKFKELATTRAGDELTSVSSTTPSSAEEGSSLMGKFNFINPKSKKLDLLPQIHKSPSLVLVYDDEYWKNVHQQRENCGGCKLTPSYSSNSLPRNFSRHLMNEC